MHTCVCDPSDPFSYALMFSNDKIPNQLRIADIYTRKLGAKMAVMGSCDTQKGQNRASEGIFGIARALNYAGCPNLIATLNTVTDAPTAAIYRYFYENLAAGKPSDVALTMAKRSYLEHPLPGMDRPYYWANTICIGPPQVIRR